MVCSNCIYFTKGVCNGFFGDFKFFSIIFIDGICVVALALVVLTISGFMFHLLLVILFINC